MQHRGDLPVEAALFYLGGGATDAQLPLRSLLQLLQDGDLPFGDRQRIEGGLRLVLRLITHLGDIADRRNKYREQPAAESAAPHAGEIEVARRDAGIKGGDRIVVMLQPQIEQQVVMAVEDRPERGKRHGRFTESGIVNAMFSHRARGNNPRSMGRFECSEHTEINLTEIIFSQRSR